MYSGGEEDEEEGLEAEARRKMKAKGRGRRGNRSEGRTTSSGYLKASELVVRSGPKSVGWG